MIEPRNGLWLLHHVDPIQLGVAAGIMDMAKDSFGSPMVGLGEYVSLGFLKRELNLGDLKTEVLADGTKVKDLIMDLFVTIAPAPSSVKIEAKLCFRSDRECGVDMLFATLDDFSDPKFFDRIFEVLDDVWERNTELFNRRELLKWLGHVGIPF